MSETFPEINSACDTMEYETNEGDQKRMKILYRLQFASSNPKAFQIEFK